jgi:formate hydrogenlyase subunit 3/multisubunit Na+/H+ antiporter MnhD subunit
MSAGGLLLAAAIGFPLLIAALVTLMARARARAFDLIVFAPLPALLAALVAPGEMLVFAPDPLRMVLSLDVPGAVLLGGASLLWAAAGLYARSYMQPGPRAVRFAVWWLLSQAGSLGVFIVADLASFYLVFALASLPVWGLVTYEATPRAGRAGFVYMALAMIAEAVLLLAFVLLAVGGAGNPLIRDAVAGLAGSPRFALIVTLLIVGFGLKMGLAPLHVWMPLAHPVAPMPASAVLSGIAVKAGVIGLIRFLPLEHALPVSGAVLTGLGLATAFYAVLVGVTQAHPKTVLAYSTVSQMGLVGALLGAGWAIGSPVAAGFAAYYALHHMLVKGALFLGVGIAPACRRRALPMAVMTVLGLSLAGLPLTSGALAKYAAKAVMGEGTAAMLATIAAAGSTVLMLHFLVRLEAFAEEAGQAELPRGLLLPWIVVSAAAFLVPWALFVPITAYALGDVLGLDALWKATWPILLGVAVVAAWRLWARPLPALPEGDVIALVERAAPSADRLADAVVRADEALRRWPVATGFLLFFILGLATALAG